MPSSGLHVLRHTNDTHKLMLANTHTLRIIKTNRGINITCHTLKCPNKYRYFKQNDCSSVNSVNSYLSRREISTKNQMLLIKLVLQFVKLQELNNLFF